MSEYLYYEWLTVDRPLTENELREVSGLSSHMEIVSTTQAVVTYQWGDFKHKPREVLEIDECAGVAADRVGQA